MAARRWWRSSRRNPLRELRIKLGLSQGDVALMFKLKHRVHVHLAETGRNAKQFVRLLRKLQPFAEAMQ